ncbi:hypothetical protein NPIL_470191 [Nephila pilipes]|uniref:Uncharacterized protein n=1 Tax=Nephila pilipes TaxID=299642 RepID=A0A8X6NGS2_NEPPI|nr:hypothetical protein NPIL_470191 [Nephila pilipes]
MSVTQDIRNTVKSWLEVGSRAERSSVCGLGAGSDIITSCGHEGRKKKWSQSFSEWVVLKLTERFYLNTIDYPFTSTELAKYNFGIEIESFPLKSSAYKKLGLKSDRIVI